MNRFKQKLIVMSKNNSPNIRVTDEMIINSLDTFIHKPIIEMGERKIPNLTMAIGVINNVEYKHGLVIADVTMFTDKYKDRFRYDNWMITLNKNGFDYTECMLNKEV